ncbi:MAG: hypothetical protein RMY62_018200 [Nostoc sp. ZfuVER08]|uniref:hypothetical protein n=1 Tax=Nostoc punctiforme TaxID=272131 RepID=UPI001F553513|nr:hypothetical protein [Nostoc punctiforme]MDZ8015698.1 hypothetical protein [Nostoc sp. ZfuVER08]
MFSAQLICQTWQRQYNRLPDALIVENCQQVGGHFSQCEDVNSPGFSIESVIFQSVTELMAELTQPQKSMQSNIVVQRKNPLQIN